MPVLARSRLPPVLLAVFFLVSMAGRQALSQPGNNGAGAGTYINNTFPLAPRELRQHLTRAQAAVDEERFSDAVSELGEILNSAAGDDFFLGAPGGADAQVSLKTQALELLGSMPAKGRRMYELQYGAESKAALEAALEASDLAALTEVSRRYFHTKAGYEATLLVGRYQLDQGRPLSAALSLKRVADVPSAQAQYDPELSVLLATCWLHANQPEQSADVLRELKHRLPQAKVRLVDKEVPLFARDDAALAWLEQIVGGSRLALASAASEWTLYRGNERRNAESREGIPLLNFQWKLPTVNDPHDELRVGQQYRTLIDRGEPLVCALQPLVVQDFAILRVPESNRLVGVNLKNGKRVCVFPPGEETAAQQRIREAAKLNPAANVNIRDTELRQRVWEDNAFGQVSSDGRQVYVLDDLGYAPSNVQMPPNWIGPRGVRVPNLGMARPYNLLVALDLQKEFYRNWEVGGTTGDHAALADAFFLGPPLPVGDQLYALAEFPSEIRLVCLDPRTGALEWKQQLASVVEQQFDIVNDRARRLAGASPSLADGILVCPTSAGAVVAVDLATRTLRWGYQYPRQDVVQSSNRMMVRSVLTNMSGWLDATATIADGSVILTPVESQQLHCLNLLTGKARWSPIPRDEMLFVACVHEGTIILVGKNALRAIRLADGKPAWTSDLKLEGEVASGRGYYSGRHYYLPTTGKQLVQIDLAEGKIVGQAQTEVELGNVVVAHDQLISQGPQTVASFVLLSDELRERLAERLAANPRDSDALALQAQIALQEEKPDESLALLRRAHDLDPGKSHVRNLLVKVMLTLLREDFAAHLDLTEELDKLVSDPVQRREVLRWRAQGLAHHGRTWNAFEVLLELADYELAQAAAGVTSNELVPIERELSVRLDRWLAGQLKALLDKADADAKNRMTAEINARREPILSAGNPNQLRAFLTLFGFDASSSAVRLLLADKLIASDALLEAEVVLGAIEGPAERATRGAVCAALAVLYEKAKRHELAVRQYGELAGEFAEVKCREGLTGKQLAERAFHSPTLKSLAASAWPFGQIEVKQADINAQNQFGLQRVAYALQIVQQVGAGPRGLKATYESQQSQITVRSDLGQTLGVATLRALDPQRQRYPLASNNALTGKMNGHLLVVNTSSEVVAVDGLRAERGSDALLWRQDAADLDPTKPDYQRFAPRLTSNPLLGNSRYLNPFHTGPVLASGVCFQRGRQLICVDPLSGLPLWERSSLPEAEIPAQAEIFGDEELLFVADAKPDSKSEELLVLSPLDGTLLGKRKIDRAERRWASVGRTVLAWDQAGAALTVRLKDAWDPEKELWAKTIARGSRACLIDGEEMAVLEPGGQFTVVSLASGEVQFAVPLAPEPDLSWIQVLRSRDQYLLLASQEDASSGGVNVQPPSSSANSPNSRMHGRVYAFDRETGKLAWPSPAFVDHQFLPADQPPESPLLVFVANRTDTRGPGNRPATAVLALDRRTGESVFEGEVGGPTAHCEMAADLARREVKVSLISSTSKTITFRLTDEPRPPAPPAQTGAMASRTAGQPKGAVDRSLGAAIELLQRGFAPPAPRPPPADPFAPPPR